MKLIIDTNVIISALIKDSVAREIIFSSKFNLYTLEFGKREVIKYHQLILKKTGITEEQFYNLLHRIFNKINLVSDSDINKEYYEKAVKIMDSIDENDTPFIALALSIENNGIWSDDKHFEMQDKVKIWKTKDLIEYI